MIFIREKILRALFQIVCIKTGRGVWINPELYDPEQGYPLSHSTRAASGIKRCPQEPLKSLSPALF
jgi:hypothetical protein